MMIQIYRSSGVGLITHFLHFPTQGHSCLHSDSSLQLNTDPEGPEEQIVGRNSQLISSSSQPFKQMPFSQKVATGGRQGITPSNGPSC